MECMKRELANGLALYKGAPYIPLWPLVLLSMGGEVFSAQGPHILMDNLLSGAKGKRDWCSWIQMFLCRHPSLAGQTRSIVTIKNSRLAIEQGCRWVWFGKRSLILEIPKGQIEKPRGPHLASRCEVSAAALIFFLSFGAWFRVFYRILNMMSEKELYQLLLCFKANFNYGLKWIGFWFSVCTLPPNELHRRSCQQESAKRATIQGLFCCSPKILDFPFSGDFYGSIPPSPDKIS